MAGWIQLSHVTRQQLARVTVTWQSRVHRKSQQSQQACSSHTPGQGDSQQRIHKQWLSQWWWPVQFSSRGKIVKYLIDVMNVVFRTTEPCLRWSPRVADTGGGQSPPSPPVCWEAGRGGRAVWTHCWRASSQMEETAPGDSLTPPSTGQCPEETWTQWTGETNWSWRSSY